MTWIMSECFMPPVAVAPFSSISISSTSSQPVGIEGGLVSQEFATVKALAEGPLAAATSVRVMESRRLGVAAVDSNHVPPRCSALSGLLPRVGPSTKLPVLSGLDLIHGVQGGKSSSRPGHYVKGEQDHCHHRHHD
jgi:hypothetical protein